MKIHGLQKMTLLDYPGKVACTVFLGGCDLRCPFCHNADLLDMNAPALMDDQELMKFLKTREGLLEGVAFTGGEPLLRKDLPDLIAGIRELGFKIKIDTNGNHPDRLISLVESGMADYVAMDIKNSPERYAETAGMNDIDIGPIRESVSMLLENTIDYEFRTTTVAELHNDDSFEKIGRWINGARRYYLQRFTDRETVPFQGLHSPTEEQMKHWADIVRPYVPAVELRGVD